MRRPDRDHEDRPGALPVVSAGRASGPRGEALRLVRDRFTWTAYTAFASWAWFLYGFGSVVSLLRDAQGISSTVAGLHLTGQAVGGFIAGLVGTALIRRRARRGAALTGMGLVVLGTALLSIGRPTALTLAASLIAGTGGAMIVNVLTPAVLGHHGRGGSAAISESGGISAAVGLVAPLAVGAGVGLGVTWRPAVLLLTGAVAFIAVLMTRVPATPSLDAALPPRPARAEGARGGLPRGFWAPSLAVAFCVGVEFCMSTWTPDLLRDRVGFSPGAASAGVTAVVAGMSIGRFAVGRLALRHPPRPLLVATIVVALLGWAITWTATSPPLMIVGLVVTGLGVAGHYPLGISLVMEASPGQEDHASSVLSIGFALSIGVAPFALGAVADASSVHTAFLIVAGLLAGALGTVLAIAHWSRRRVREALDTPLLELGDDGRSPRA